MLARYYSSSLGRFMAVDPGDDTELENPQSWNKYAYTRNNPLGAVDPDGKDAMDFISYQYSSQDFAAAFQTFIDNPTLGNGLSALTNFVVASADAAAMLTPGIPATGGLASRAARAAGAAADAGNVADTSRAARRQAMREQGVPTSQQPRAQSNTPAGRQYEYDTPAPGGGTETKVVTQHGADGTHGPHWEAGTAKPAGSVDSQGRRRHYNEDPATGRPKSRVEYNTTESM
jgi:hypothetical protein